MPDDSVVIKLELAKHLIDEALEVYAGRLYAELTMSKKNKKKDKKEETPEETPIETPVEEPTEEPIEDPTPDLGSEPEETEPAAEDAEPVAPEEDPEIYAGHEIVENDNGFSVIRKGVHLAKFPTREEAENWIAHR